MWRVAGWFLWWLIGWGDLLDGICWIATFGLLQPDASLRLIKVWMDIQEERKKGGG